MRLLLLASLVAAIAAAVDHYEVAKQVLRSWNPHAPVTYIDDHEETQHDAEEPHLRSKRSVFADMTQFVGPDKSCQTPGFTGEFCENPICPSPSGNIVQPPDIGEFGPMFDSANLANCSQHYVLLVDETQSMFTIEIESADGSNVGPWFSLQAEDGTIIMYDSIDQTPQKAVYTYFTLAPGKYQVLPFTDVARTDITTYCTLVARALTTMNVAGGFINDDSDYATRADYAESATYQGLQTTVIFHPISLPIPGILKTVTFTGPDNTLFRPRLLGTRYNCTYQFYYEGFTCKKAGTNYLYHVEGVSFQGFSFRRVYTFTCFPPLPTTAPTTISPPTTPAPLTQCYNGGVLLNDTNGNPYCMCQGLFEGRDCKTAMCLNGGTHLGAILNANACNCPLGYDGRFCQDIVCPDSEELNFDASHPTLTLVLRVRSQTADVINQVIEAANKTVNKLQFDPTYLQDFVLVTFNNGQFNGVRYTKWSDVETAIRTALTNADNSGGCYDKVYTAVIDALNHSPNVKSPIFVVTDAPPQDTENEDTVFFQDSFYRAPINFLYVQPTDLNCQLTPDDPSYRSMEDISHRSGGQTFYINNQSNVENLLETYLTNTLYRSQLMLANDISMCGKLNSYQSLTVDSAAEMVVVVATGKNIDISLTTYLHNGTSYNPIIGNLHTMYNDGETFIGYYMTLFSGTWLLNVTSSQPNAACGFRVFQKAFNNIVTTDGTFDMFWAFTPSLRMNSFGVQPVQGFGQGIVVHLTDFPFISPTNVHAGLTIYANRNNQQTFVYGSNAEWRNGCSYKFYFNPYTCKNANEQLYFTFFVRDNTNSGQGIQRAGTMYCSYIAPTQQPPSDCQNGGVINAANTTCFCPMGWTGDRCQNIVCFNGGTAKGNTCSCTAAYIGDNCEIPRCTEPNINPEYTLSNVDMVFVLELTQSAAGQVVYLDKYFGDILRDVVSQNPTWIGKFVIVGFNSTWADVMATAPASDYSSLVTFLHNLAAQVFTDPKTDKGCNPQLFRAINIAIRRGDAVPGSFIEIFTASPPNNNDEFDADQIYYYSREANLRITTYIATKNTDGSFYCNGTADDWNGLSAISFSTTGNVYVYAQSNQQYIIKTIPIQYSQGILYSQAQDYCSDGQQFYFPVDAFVQALQLDVYGASPTITVTDAAGKSQNIDTLLSDTLTNVFIGEIRTGCDEEWYEHGQYCYYEFADNVDWNTAKQECHNAGGQLADDLTDDKNSFIGQKIKPYAAWIGLFFQNNTWYWDAPTGIAPQPLGTQYTAWDGGSPPTDPNLACVYYQAANGRNVWVAADCNERHFVYCQKHRYDQNFTPPVNSVDDLPDGKWYITVKTNPTAANPSTACSVTIRVQSNINVITGYVQQINNDYPDADPFRDSSMNRVVSYLTAPDNDNREALLQMAYITDAYNLTFYNAARYTWRYGCAYQWVTQQFACPNAQSEGNEFMIAHSGEDAFGNMFQRITFGHCERRPLTCGNGNGIAWQGLCICNEYWSGRYCNVPLCVNGGTLNPDDSTCKCPAGYAGPNCQYVQCSQDNRFPYTFDPTNKMLILVVENTVQNAPAVQQLIANIADIITTTNNNAPNFIYNIELVLFNSGGVTFMQNYFLETIPQLVADLTAQSTGVTDQGSCKMPLYNAVGAFLHSDDLGWASWPNSHLFVITAAGATDDVNQNRDDLAILSDNGIIAEYIYISNDKCGELPTDGSLNTIVQTIYTSTGGVAFVYPNDLANYMKNYLPSRYLANTLSNPTYHLNFTCSGNNWLVEVDKNTTSIYVLTNALIGNIGVQNPMKQSDVANEIFSSGSTKLYRIDTYGLGGIYTMNYVSIDACYASVYAVGGLVLYPRFGIVNDTANLIGTSDPNFVDGRYGDPVAFQQNVASIHVAGPQGHRGQLLYADILDVDSLTLILRSELYQRVDCSFEYYTDPFTCNSDLLTLRVYGMDENYAQFRRQFVAYCLNSTVVPVTPPGTYPTVSTTPTTVAPTTISTASTPSTVSTASTPSTAPISTASTPTTTSPAQPTASTQAAPTTTSFGNANLLFDVYFLLDVSSTAQAVQTDIINFVNQLMASYSIGDSGVHVGLIPVTGDAFPVFPSPALGGITSYGGLLAQLNQLYSLDNTFDETGQYLKSALEAASNPNSITWDAGYRKNVTNHLIVYVTATTLFSDNPSTATILQQNLYGVIAVGYGASANDMTALTGIAGGQSCAFTAMDANGLTTTAAQSVQNLIWNANFNGGVYCGNTPAN